MTLDWNKIDAAVDSDESLMVFDRGDAKDLTRGAIEDFLAADLEQFEILEVEQKRDTYGIKYIIDFKARDRKTGDIWVADWKTSKNTLDIEWRNRLIDSWQWRMYVDFEAAKFMSYRGLSRSQGKAVEVIIPTPEENHHEVWEHLNGISVQVSALITDNAQVWPRNKPGACHAFGRECPYYTDCRNYVTIPRGIPSRVLEGRYGSYSSFEVFNLCNEKFRRKMMEEGESGESEEAAFGHAVHRGLAEAYRQGAGLV